MSFQGLRAHFFLLLNNIPLPGCTTVYFSIPPLRDVLVPSKVWLLQSCYEHLGAGFCADRSFQLLWINAEVNTVAGSYGLRMLRFGRNHPSSSGAVPVCIPTSTATNESSASSSALVAVSGLDSDHLKGISEKAMAPHSSTLAWKIPWTEEPGRLQSMGSLGVGHDWATSLSLFTFMHWRRKWQPTLVFLPAESQGQGSLVGCRLWGHTESDMTEATYQQQRCVTVFLCFNLSIPDNIRCAASLHMLICHVHIFSGEVSIKMFGPFFKLFSYCWVLRVLCVFWVTVVYQICICKYFLPVSKLVSSFSWQCLL